MLAKYILGTDLAKNKVSGLITRAERLQDRIFYIFTSKPCI